MANQLNFSIHRSSPVPLYHQVVQGIEAAIHSGLLSPGSRLDNEIDQVGGKPLALMENWVRDDITAIDEAQLSTQGLYSILRDGGVNFRLASQRIGAMVANDYQAPLLETTPGSALVTMERTAVDDTGRMVETGHHVYRTDSYSFEMTLVQR